MERKFDVEGDFVRRNFEAKFGCKAVRVAERE